MRGTMEATRRIAASGRERPGSLSDRVAAEIGRRIVTGQYPPGETLPTEPKVQEEFGVSRTAVREAIRLLSAKGLTVSRPKIGTKVRPRADWNMLDSDVLSWQLDQRPSDEFIHSLFEMREIIEPAAAARAAERATEEELETLRVALEGIQNRERGSSDQIRSDLAFHMTVLEASHNPMLRSVGSLIESGLVVSFSLGWRTVMGDDAVLQHRDVYEAIRKRDPEEAYLAMRRLLRNAKGNVFDSIWVSRRVDSGADKEIR
ncbi:FadR family transcriptional regulator [Kaistia algarum]|uniref:FadR/GntR family transcriptional regulator n=1 Tax=Kaistia algarum TaxID=2083279 RepID=UPI000CE91159|nr:FadR/GntR family transcriptional regulator [Kaistia algarum]MCX5514721.1 FadR/GntR family transcriptional regulator [Kaistia algarum]PPE78856.1 FadR family transcriptional regulator [Kaistia algarum]